MSRSFVPFDGIWSMAIDVPYSYLLRDGDLAWSCGQLALDGDSTVLHPGDLGKQSEVVADYVEQILQQAKLSADGLRRLYLYHAASTTAGEAEMLSIFRERFGSEVLLQPIAVPHFYYDGVLLEVDMWWSGGDTMRWGTAAAPSANASRFSEHLVVPSGQFGSAFEVPDPGAIIDGGRHMLEPVFLHADLPGKTVSTEVVETDATVIVVRRADGFAWLQGRSLDGSLDLVAQTEAIMARFDQLLPNLGFSYGDVAKSTTHYVGGSSAEELHGNMSVRNRRYTKPGPASTGLPVYGFADAASKVVIDITLVRR